MTEPSTTLDRLEERVQTFVELSARVDAAFAPAREGGGPEEEWAGEVRRLAGRLGSESHQLLERLSRLRGRSKLRVMIGLLVTRGRQRRVAELAHEVAASLSDATGGA